MLISNSSSKNSRSSSNRVVVIITYSQPAISVITTYRLFNDMVEASLIMFPWRNRKSKCVWLSFFLSLFKKCLRYF